MSFKNRFLTAFLLFLIVCTLFTGCDLATLDGGGADGTTSGTTYTGEYEVPALTKPTLDLASIPAYSGNAYIAVNGNVPSFTENQLTKESYEFYSELDSLGRCGVTVACIGIDLMPTEDRGSISSVRPSGWQSVKYDIVDGKYLYNRCHLIGFQLTGENANKENLITGTRYLNIEGMLPFENMIADYVKETENHVLFRVTPIYEGNNLVASGVHMEAYSVEDNGDGISFNVYAYNVQPGISINYANGLSELGENVEFPSDDTSGDDTSAGDDPNGGSDAETYILNTNSKKFHDPDCSSVDSMSEANKETYVGDRDDLIGDGYEPCGICDP